MGKRTRIPLHYIGWGLLLAWLFCTFYTRITALALPSPAIEPLGGFAMRAAFAIAPVLFAVVTILALIAGERRCSDMESSKGLSIVAACVTGAFTPLMCLRTGDAALDGASYLVGGIASGIGSGFMWVSWGALYAKLDQETTESASIIACAGAILVALGVSAMVGWAAVGLVSSLPLVSGWLLRLSWLDQSEAEPGRKCDGAPSRAIAANKEKPFEALSRVWKGSWGLLYLSVFVCIAGSFWERSDTIPPSFQAVLAIGVLFVIGVGLMAQFGPRQTSIVFLCRWASPLVVLALALVAFDASETGLFIASSIALLCRFAFCMVTQMHFARFAKRGLATPIQAYGMGWILIHVGDLVGLLAFEAVSASDPIGGRLFALASIVVLVAGVMVFLGRDDSFVTPAQIAAMSLADDKGHRQNSEQDAASRHEGFEDPREQRILQLARSFGLTERETAVFELLMKGRSVPYIRDELVISKNTVATHVKHIYAKSGVHTRQELLDLM